MEEHYYPSVPTARLSFSSPFHPPFRFPSSSDRPPLERWPPAIGHRRSLLHHRIDLHRQPTDVHTIDRRAPLTVASSHRSMSASRHRRPASPFSSPLFPSVHIGLTILGTFPLLGSVFSAFLFCQVWIFFLVAGLELLRLVMILVIICGGCFGWKIGFFLMCFAEL